MDLWRRRSVRVGATIATGLALALGLIGCFGGGDDETKPGEAIEITCLSCQESATDPTIQIMYDEMQRFNKKYAGRYQVKSEFSKYATPLPDRPQYFKRRALADDLPDVFIVSGAEGVEIAESGKLIDLAPILDKDPEWKDSFHPNSFYQLETGDGELIGIPLQRDAIGAFYNKKILQESGVSEYPETWDDLARACEKIKRTGKYCLAMDGDHVTILWWANLIGTQPGGAEFLKEGIKSCDYADNPEVIKATETLKSWHTAGYVNPDSFSGDFVRADTLFLKEEAAFLANGPWEVPVSIQGKQAAKGLYDRVGYGPAPGWTTDEHGMMVIAGEGAIVTSSQDEDKLEAALAFMKFLTSDSEQIPWIQATGAFTAVNSDFSEEDEKKLEPLTLALNEHADELPEGSNYPNAWSPRMSTAWKNLWPAYVKGDIDTGEFLDRIVQDGCTESS